MSMLPLAIQAQLPLIHIVTDDIINVEEVLTFIAGKPVRPLALPEQFTKASDLKFPENSLFYTSSECKSLAKLYNACVDLEKTIIFVNTDKSVLQFDGEALYPPQDMVKAFLKDIVDDDEKARELLPSFGGLTLKDVGEIAKLTMTRDDSLSVSGVSETRRGYAGKIRGIDQVDTNLPFYLCPKSLKNWLKANKKFFLEPAHPSLIPRGLLFDGPPGTGKTMAAKAIAAAFGVPLYRLDLGAMMGKYVGESEGNLVAALAQVDQVEPCVVLFDEVEKIFQSSGDSGVTSRLLSQLLWWLQEHKTKVFSVMTTNKLKSIPEELYREGRIDETMLFMGIETVEEGQKFAEDGLKSMALDIGYELQDTDSKEVALRIKGMFKESPTVAQAKITQTVFSMLKEFTVKGDE